VFGSKTTSSWTSFLGILSPKDAMEEGKNTLYNRITIKWIKINNK